MPIIINGTIFSKNTKVTKWFMGEGAIKFINCTINKHSISGSYTSKDINKKINNDYKAKGTDSVVCNLPTTPTYSFDIENYSTLNNVEINGSNNKQVDKVKNAQDIMLNGSGQICSKGDIQGYNIIINGSGVIATKTNIQGYNITINGSGQIKSHDQITAHNVSVNGSGQIIGKEFKVSEGTIYNTSRIEGKEKIEINKSKINLLGIFYTKGQAIFNECDFNIPINDNLEDATSMLGDININNSSSVHIGSESIYNASFN